MTFNFFFFKSQPGPKPGERVLYKIMGLSTNKPSVKGIGELLSVTTKHYVSWLLKVILFNKIYILESYYNIKHIFFNHKICQITIINKLSKGNTIYTVMVIFKFTRSTYQICKKYL